MIPKIIHWCWLSNDPIPKNIQNYIDTWKRVLPDYEIWLWNFDRFDKSSSKWVSDAFDNKKYAFAADYIRLYALYNYGGIYLDSDVQVLNSYNPFLSLPTMLCWGHGDIALEVASFGAEKGTKWIGDCLDFYKTRNFIKEDGGFDMLPLPHVINKILHQYGYIMKNISMEDVKKGVVIGEKEIPVLPSDYFSPKSFDDDKLYLTERTVSIHQFAGTWISKWDLFKHHLKCKLHLN